MIKTMRKIIKNPWFLLIVIFLIAAFLRFYHIAELPPGFYPDEAINANNGIEAWETGHLKIFYPENNGREGLWMNIVGFFVFRFGNEPWIPRAIAATFGLFTLLGVYFLAKELFKENLKSQILNLKNTSQNSNLFKNWKSKIGNSRGEKIALLSAFLLATSFWHINFSRIGFRAIMAPFFLIWAIYFLLLALRQIKENKPAKFYILNSIFAGIFYGFGFHTYIAYRATPLLVLTILLFYWISILRTSDVLKLIRKKKFLISAFYFLLSTIIAAAPLGLYFLKNPQDFLGRTSQISVFSSPNPVKTLGINILKTAGMFNFVGDGNWRHNIAGRPELFWPVGILFVIGVILSIIQVFKFLISNFQFLMKTKMSNDQNTQKLGIGNWELGIPLIWLAVAALPVIISNEGLPHALRAILMAPPVFILAGIGGIWLYDKIKNFITNDNTITRDSIAKIRMLNIFVFIFLSLFVFEAYATYFILWGKNPNTAGAFSANYVEIGRQLNTLPKETPKYVIVKASGVLVRGIPMPAQTVMFITDTFTPEKQKEKNIFYLLPEQINQLPQDSYTIILE